MAARQFLALALAMAAVVVVAGDPESTLDFCVKDPSPTNSIRSTGYACKPTANVTSADFIFPLVPVAPAGRFQIGIAAAFADQWGALNAQGVSLLRLDFGVGGLVPAHTHPRASEIFYVTKGKVLSGFVTSDGSKYEEVVTSGKAFLFPKGLIHYQKNVGSGVASGLSFLNSQNPGLQLTSGALLASGIDPAIVAQDWNVALNTVNTVITAYAS